MIFIFGNSGENFVAVYYFFISRYAFGNVISWVE